MTTYIYIYGGTYVHPYTFKLPGSVELRLGPPLIARIRTGLRLHLPGFAKRRGRDREDLTLRLWSRCEPTGEQLSPKDCQPPFSAALLRQMSAPRGRPRTSPRSRTPPGLGVPAPSSRTGILRPRPPGPRPPRRRPARVAPGGPAPGSERACARESAGRGEAAAGRGGNRALHTLRPRAGEYRAGGCAPRRIGARLVPQAAGGSSSASGAPPGEFGEGRGEGDCDWSPMIMGVRETCERASVFKMDSQGRLVGFLLKKGDSL